MWGTEMNLSNARSREVLGIDYREMNQSIVDMVDSMIEKGLLEDKRTK